MFRRDFLEELDGRVMPLEVKAGINTKAKSLKQYQERFNPSLVIRSSLNNQRYDKSSSLYDIPLWALGSIDRRIQET